MPKDERLKRMADIIRVLIDRGAMNARTIAAHVSGDRKQIAETILFLHNHGLVRPVFDDKTGTADVGLRMWAANVEIDYGFDADGLTIKYTKA